MTTEKPGEVFDGACSCGHVCYAMHAQPLFVHCCHCHWCQKETGSAFALNALIESSNLEIVRGQVRSILTPSNSGAGQVIVRCKECQSALWSHYGAAKGKISFLRVGTLNNAISIEPDIHIYTSSKQSWVNLEGAIPTVHEYYRRSEYWPTASIKRHKLAIES